MWRSARRPDLMLAELRQRGTRHLGTRHRGTGVSGGHISECRLALADLRVRPAAAQEDADLPDLRHHSAAVKFLFRGSREICGNELHFAAIVIEHQVWFF